MIVAFLLGLCLLLYPLISNYWNSMHQTRAIANYAAVVENAGESEKELMWNEAVLYNKELSSNTQIWKLTDKQREEYESLLDVTGTGIMGYVEIPKIHVYLPIYHGVNESVLQIAIGHLEGTSLPTGGESTHCVISGHRGLTSAKLFSELDQIEEGDLFVLTVLDEILTYEVDQIRIVEPDELQDLEIVQGRDYCTLVTCTPYGVNSHRLLVRGHRTENVEDYTSITANAVEFSSFTVATAIAIPILIVLFLIVMISTRKKKNDKIMKAFEEDKLNK